MVLEKAEIEAGKGAAMDLLYDKFALLTDALGGVTLINVLEDLDAEAMSAATKDAFDGVVADDEVADAEEA